MRHGSGVAFKESFGVVVASFALRLLISESSVVLRAASACRLRAWIRSPSRESPFLSRRAFLFVAFGSKALASKKNALVVRSLVKRTVLREGKGLSSVVVVNFVVLGESTMPLAG